MRAFLICWEDENWRCFSCVSFSFSCLDWGKGDKRKSSPHRGSFFVHRRSGKGYLDENRLLLFVGKMKIEGFKHRYFYTIRGGRIDISARYFSKKLWGRMQYAPTLTDEKGAFSLLVVGRGRVVLAGMCFMYFMVMFFVMIIG